MSNKAGNAKKAAQLGMPSGTAANQLRKMVMFSLIQRLDEDWCFRCGEPIETVDELSLEHKEHWLDVDVDLFWDLDNVAWSHLSCNSGAKRHREYPERQHGTLWKYQKDKCRCEACLAVKSEDNAKRTRKNGRVV